MDRQLLRISVIIAHQYSLLHRYLLNNSKEINPLSRPFIKAAEMCRDHNGDPELWVEAHFHRYKPCPYPNMLHSWDSYRIYKLLDKDESKLNAGIQFRYLQQSIKINGDIQSAIFNSPFDLTSWFIYLVSKQLNIPLPPETVSEAIDFFKSFPTYRSLLSESERKTLIDDLSVERSGYFDSCCRSC